jgi:hypothetical protein
MQDQIRTPRWKSMDKLWRYSMSRHSLAMLRAVLAGWRKTHRNAVSRRKGSQTGRV